VELLISLGIFSLISVLLFSLFNRGTKAILGANARQQAQLSLNKSHSWLQRDLEQSNPRQIDSKKMPVAGQGDAVWFLTAEDPLETDPNLKFKRVDGTGSPLYQANVLYYLVRPSDYSKIADGLLPDLDPDPTADFFAPHKFLIRKVIDRTPDPADKESLLTQAEVDSYLTAPVDYTLTPFESEKDVVDYRLIADKMLSFEVLLDQSVAEIKTSALRIDEARRSEAIGKVSFKNHPLTSHRLARFQLRK